MPEQADVKQTGSMEEFGAFIGRHWKTIGSMAAVAMASGFIMIPASKVEMKDAQQQIGDLQRQVVRVDAKVDKVDAKVEDLSKKLDASLSKISDKLDGIVDAQSGNAVEVARLSAKIMSVDQVKSALQDRSMGNPIDPEKPKAKRVAKRSTGFSVDPQKPLPSKGLINNDTPPKPLENKGAQYAPAPQPVAEKPAVKAEQATWLERVLTK